VSKVTLCDSACLTSKDSCKGACLRRGDRPRLATDVPGRSKKRQRHPEGVRISSASQRQRYRLGQGQEPRVTATREHQNRQRTTADDVRAPVVARLQGVSGTTWFALVVLAVFAVALVSLLRRQRQEAPLNELIRGQPVVLTTAALVRMRASGAEGFGWVTLKSPRGARLVVHGGGIEATIGRADGLISGNFMRASDATMWRDRVGWAGTFIGKRDCIRLHGFDSRTMRDWAVSPRGTSIDEVWQALLAVGVTPTEPSA
jgi:hypothetical protein